jgi:hypothetical protein
MCKFGFQLSDNTCKKIATSSMLIGEEQDPSNSENKVIIEYTSEKPWLIDIRFTILL